MKFSERYGYTLVNEALCRETIPLSTRTRIWNNFYSIIFNDTYRSLLNGYSYTGYEHEKLIGFGNVFYDFFLNEDLELFNLGLLELRIKEQFDLSHRWNRVFDFIEFFIQNYPFEKEVNILIENLNRVLKEEKSAYRIINKQIAEITSEEEIVEINKALSLPDKFSPVNEHLTKALKHFSNRDKPDYENSIKESISALESLTKIILGEKGTLGELTKKLQIHPALKSAISQLYGWASDEKGIRHGSDNKTTKIDEEETKLILILSSSLINYIYSKNK